MQFTPKETSLLKELKNQEKLCADKYARAADAAIDGQLKGLFSNLRDEEQNHFDTLSGIERGNVPVPPGGQKPAPTFTPVYTAESPDKQNDCFLCTDLLSAEKHASSLYDTSVFEFRDEHVRNALNHIQKEEQAHGKALYNYMSVNGMYETC
jgi:rubrerythrin